MNTKETYENDGVLEIQYFAKTNVGNVRTRNEDNFIVGPSLDPNNEWTLRNDSFEVDTYGSVFIVADGMGGAVAGKIASTIAVESIKNALLSLLQNCKTEAEIGQVLTNSLKIANKDIIEYADKNPACAGMGTTATICFVKENRLFIAWIGDSRVYRYSKNGRVTSNTFNQGNLEILTDDHSLVWNDVLKGLKTPEEARVARNSNVITQSLGDIFSTLKPDLRIYNLFEGDFILNCSDGLNSMLSDSEIEHLFKINEINPELLADQFILQANNAGGKDNTTVILMHVMRGPAYVDVTSNLKTKEVTQVKDPVPVQKPKNTHWFLRNIGIINSFFFVFVLSGTLFIAYSNFDSIKSSFKKFLNIDSDAKENTSISGSEKPIEPEKKEIINNGGKGSGEELGKKKKKVRKPTRSQTEKRSANSQRYSNNTGTNLGDANENAIQYKDTTSFNEAKIEQDSTIQDTTLSKLRKTINEAAKIDPTTVQVEQNENDKPSVGREEDETQSYKKKVQVALAKQDLINMITGVKHLIQKNTNKTKRITRTKNSNTDEKIKNVLHNIELFIQENSGMKESLKNELKGELKEIGSLVKNTQDADTNFKEVSKYNYSKIDSHLKVIKELINKSEV